MVDTSHSVGAAFDAAVMQGDLFALTRLRRALERAAALATCQRSIESDATVRSLGDALHDAVAPLLERGAAVVEWQRVIRWMTVSRSGERPDGCDTLVALATQRRDKAARKYRQWLAQPGCRSARKRLARALSQAADDDVLLPGWHTDWDAQRHSLANVDLSDPASVQRSADIMQGWCELWRILGQDELEPMARARIHLLRLQQASRLIARLQSLLKHTDDKHAWQCVGVLQSQLQSVSERRGAGARDAALLFRLPLTPRFGVSDNPAP